MTKQEIRNIINEEIRFWKKKNPSQAQWDEQWDEPGTQADDENFNGLWKEKRYFQIAIGLDSYHVKCRAAIIPVNYLHNMPMRSFKYGVDKCEDLTSEITQKLQSDGYRKIKDVIFPMLKEQFQFVETKIAGWPIAVLRMNLTENEAIQILTEIKNLI